MSFDPLLAFTLAASILIYHRGWRSYRWPLSKLAAFAASHLVLYLALTAPIERLAPLRQWAHMLQHLLLTMAVPPLVWASTPLLPLMRGLPRETRSLFAPLIRGGQWWVGWIANPVPATVCFVLTMWLWHVPKLYQAALQDDSLHYLQHACFLLAGLAFWFPVLRPYPFRPRYPLWHIMLMLLAADLANTALSALLTFSPTILYPQYAIVSTLEDQAAAGVLMWVPGSVMFLVPLAVLGVNYLRAVPRSKQRMPLAMTTDPRFDLLAVPIIGSFLRLRHSRVVLQLPLLVLAVLIVIDGFTGPEEAPMNLAGVLPWIHWRGVLILTLLLAGNFFCTACPFTLPRRLLGFLPQGRSWPKRLRSKWLAAGLVILFFTAYEVFALWNSPWLTAAIIVGYFVAAFTVDTLFRGSAFCQYVCPIGQFNFTQSLMSPLTVKAKDAAVCDPCTTKDCLKACGTHLNVPKKTHNLDCTLCLDCVHVCPHDNIGIVNERSLPGEPRRDVAFLVLMMVLAAFTNAAGMVGPVLDAQVSLAKSLSVSPRVVVIVFNLMCLVALPLVLLKLLPTRRAVFALLPLGFALWLAHYGFHLATSYETVWPVTQQFLGLGEPAWSCSCCQPVGSWLLKTELLILDVGLLASWFVGLRLRVPRWWLGFIVLLFALAVWILIQPMDMRGTMS